MTQESKKQIEMVMKRQKKLAMLAIDPSERSQIYGVWAGFLGGMKLTGAITNKEYQKLYDEMVSLIDKKLLA